MSTVSGVRRTHPSPSRSGHTPTPLGVRGGTVWLTGLSGAGKTTIAQGFAEAQRARGRAVEVLDGDELREHLSPGLGFSREDRDAHVRRVGYLARLLARNGVLVLVPVIAPYAATRAQVRAEHEADGTPYVDVYVSTSLAHCAERDVKGLYAAHAAGRISGLTGVDDPYEEPEAPDLVLDAGTRDLDECLALLTDHLTRTGSRLI